jgi:D-xylulose reductase
MQALVLERKGELSIREIALPTELGPHDVKISIDTVGICGSDVHYYEYGAIGPFVVKEPMVLGHEASGTVVEVGHAVKNLKPGDRVCMEPGIPDPNSRASRLGIYNLDPAVRFWATPPIHGCLTPYVIHPAAYTFKLPENVSFAEGAMVEPSGSHGSRPHRNRYSARRDCRRMQSSRYHGRPATEARSCGFPGSDPVGKCCERKPAWRC